MVDDHLGRSQRVDLFGIAAQTGDGFAHGGQIDHAGHAGEVLHDHARRRERDFVAGGGLGIPVEQGLDIAARDVDAVFKAQLVLQQNLEREGQARQPFGRQGRQAPVVVLAVAAMKCLSCLKAVGHDASLNCAQIIARYA